MTHPILILQTAFVTALRDDAALSALTDGPKVFDAPPEGEPPYLVIARHDLVPRSGDLAPGQEHRVIVHLWAGQPSRKAVLALAEQVEAVAAGFVAEGLAISLRSVERVDTAIDAGSGLARAALTLRFFSEPEEDTP